MTRKGRSAHDLNHSLLKNIIKTAMLLPFICICILSQVQLGIAQTWSPAAHTWGGPLADSGSAVALDSAGNVYVAGSTESFGAGGEDALIIKYSSDGTFLWAKTWGGSGNDYFSSIRFGPDGYLYASGGTSSFGAGWYDLLLLKLDTNGNLVWGTTWGGSSYEGGYDIGFDETGNILVAGESYSTSPCCAAVVLKFSTSGALLNSVYYKGPATYDSAYSLTVDSNSNVIVAGISWDYSYSPLHNSILLLKYDQNLNLLWQENWATPFPGQDQSDAFHAVTTDSAGNIYVGGEHSNQCLDANFGYCDFDALLLGVDPNGAFLWARTWGTVASYEAAGSVVLDSGGHLLEGGIENQAGLSAGPTTLFIDSYDTGGNLLSQTAWSSQDTIAINQSVGIALDPLNNAYVASAATNNMGSWAAMSASSSSLSASLIANTYSTGIPTEPMTALTNPLAAQTGKQNRGGGGPDLFVAQYQSYMGGGPFISTFPLPDWTPYSPHRINSVFDHSMPHQYCPNTDSSGYGTVMAYDGEEGSSQYLGSQVGTQKVGCATNSEYNYLFGYEQDHNVPFSLYGEYFGASAPGFLFYEGHPGYDYRAACETKVVAAVSGTVHYPQSIPGAGGAKFHILEIDPDLNSTYKIYYLHLANWLSNNCIYSGSKQNCSCPYKSNVVAEGQHVNAGDPVGYSGDTGVPFNPHLHFEVQLQPAGIPVDPYGWSPIPGIAQTDPYQRAVNVNLWSVPQK